jgi:transposase
MTPPPDLSRLTEAEKDALIPALWARVQALTARVAELEARLSAPPKTPGNSSLPPSKGHKANRPERERRAGPRRGSLGRAGGGRPLAEEPDQFVIAKAAACAHCRAALDDAAQVLHARYDKVELPPVRPVVTRVERYLGRCPCCGGATLASVPEGLEEGSPFGVSILALALYLRFTHAISYRRLTRLFPHLFALPISEGALDALFRRAKPRFEDEAAAILARLRRARVVCSDETTVRVDGRTCWDWVFRNDEVVIHVVRPSRGRAVVAEVLGGHRPEIWVSDLYSASAWNGSWTGSWPCSRATAAVSGCAGATSRCATACSPSSSTPTRRRTTTAASGTCGRWWCTARSPAGSARPGVRTCAPRSRRWSAPPPGAGSTPTTPSLPSYPAGPSSPPVEQLQTFARHTSWCSSNHQFRPAATV